MARYLRTDLVNFHLAVMRCETVSRHIGLTADLGAHAASSRRAHLGQMWTALTGRWWLVRDAAVRPVKPAIRA